MIHLRGRGADVVLDVSTGTPVIVHWGPPLGEGADLDSLTSALERPITNGMLDVVAPVSVVPEHGSGFVGSPGLVGHRRGGVAWAPRFVPGTVRPQSASSVVVTAIDEIAGLQLETTVDVDDVLRLRCALTNTAESRYLLDHLSISLPVAAHASELMTFTGRWTRE